MHFYLVYLKKQQWLFLQVALSEVFWGRLYSNGKGLSPLSFMSIRQVRTYQRESHWTDFYEA
jgi:hypothetical protein